MIDVLPSVGASHAVHVVRDGADEVHALLQIAPPGTAEATLRDVAGKLAALGQASIPETIDVGTTAEGEVCWVVAGDPRWPTLASAMASDGLSAEAARAVFRAIAACLAHAHAAGIFHAALHPQSILLGPEGPMVCGLGLPRPPRSEAELQDRGILALTPPEVLLGEDGSPARSDTYALGVMLLEVWAHRPAFLGSHAAIVAAKQRPEGIDVPASMPADLAQVVRECTRSRERPAMSWVAQHLGATLPRAVTDGVWRPVPLSARIDVASPTDDVALGVGDDDDDDDAEQDGPEVGSRPQVAPALPERPEDEPIGAAPMSAFVLGVSLLAAAFGITIGVVVWRVASERPPPPVMLTIDVDADAVRVAGGSAVRIGNAWVADVPAGRHAVTVARGPMCEDDLVCGACCACRTHAVVAEGASMTVILDAATPAGPQLVTIRPQGATAQEVTRVRAGDRELVRGSEGWTGLAPLGRILVQVDVGDCSDAARGCEQDCPPGCTSIVSEVEVTCGVRATELEVASPPSTPLP